MSGFEIAGLRQSQVIGTIGTNGTLSEEFDLTGYGMPMLLLDNLTLGTLTFLVSDKPLAPGVNTYRQVLDNTGTAKSVGPISGNVAIACDYIIQTIGPARYVRLLMSSAQANGPRCCFVVKA